MRVRIFAIALAGVFMALSLPAAYGRLGLLFGFAYWGGRFVLGMGMLRVGVRNRQIPVNPFLVSLVLTGPMLVAGGFLHSDTARRCGAWRR